MSPLMYAEELAPAELPPRPTEEGAQPESSRPGRREGILVALLCVLTVGAVALYFDKLYSVDLGAMNGLGLISVLPVSTLLGLALLTVGFAALDASEALLAKIKTTRRR